MCGIVGIVSKNPSKNASKQVGLMAQKIVHRGPDSVGKINRQQLNLAIRRLSIIDVKGGNQPLYNENKSITLIINGEIYNYKELTRKLKRKGHKFRTQSDCETICHLYEDHGINALSHLRGMFAFALIDKKQNKFFLARDRLGEKPLFIHQTKTQLYFASELKALLTAIPKSQKTIDPVYFDQYMHYQYVPEPNTIIKNVSKLPAAHYLELDLNTWQTSTQCYWQIDKQKSIDPANHAQAVRSELQNIAKIVGRSDVPVGISLSGGLDSSTVAAVISKYSENKSITHAFTVGYQGEPEYDERKHARIVAKHLGLKLHEVELGNDQLSSEFTNLITASDEPIADISALAFYHVMKLAHQHNIKVLLSGIGGDELFWGYPWVREAVRLTSIKKDQFHSNSFTSAISRLSHGNLYSRFKNEPQNQLEFYNTQPDFAYLHQALPRLYSSKLINTLEPNNSSKIFQTDDWSNVPQSIMLKKISTWLISNSIALSDKISMANSIELRLPLVDHKIIELVFALNNTANYHKQPPKQLLKDAVADLLPQHTINRTKQAFRPPSGQWMRSVVDKYAPLLHNGKLVKAGLITNTNLNKLKPQQHRGPNQFIFYKLVFLELWLRQFVHNQHIANQ